MSTRGRPYGLKPLRRGSRNSPSARSAGIRWQMRSDGFVGLFRHDAALEQEHGLAVR